MEAAVRNRLQAGTVAAGLPVKPGKADWRSWGSACPAQVSILRLGSRILPCSGVRPSQHAIMVRSAVDFEQLVDVPGRATITKNLPRVLSVAGSDSGAGAGIQADIKACAALGVFCTTAVTALTAQNTVGVQGIHAVPEEFVEAQMKSILSDIGADVVKTGMLPSSRIIESVCAVLKDSQLNAAVVVDPVLAATSGDSLADSSVLGSFRNLLFPLADIVTPNITEASILLDGMRISNLEEVRSASAMIHKMGPRFVLIKGGHGSSSSEVVDILYDGHEWHEFGGPRVETRNTHGTGCTLASAIAAFLAKGFPVLEAVKEAKTYVGKVIKYSAELRIGRGVQGPMDHFRGHSYTDDVTGCSARGRFKGEDLLLYAVTDSGMNRKWGRSTEAAVRAAIEGGATFLQIREKEADTGDFLLDAEASVKVAREHGVPLVINDRVDVALACDADGVHLGQSDMPVARARALLGLGKIIGVSCKTPEQVKRAWEDGADYVGSGGVYPTNTKKGNATIGLAGLRRVCEASPIPVVAIGGIKFHNALEVVACSGPPLYGVAVVSELFDQPDVAKATSTLKGVLTSRPVARD